MPQPILSVRNLVTEFNTRHGRLRAVRGMTAQAPQDMYGF